jgi:hypothetical protein
MATREEDESYQWWDNFLKARLAAIHAMQRLGKTDEEIFHSLTMSPMQFELLKLRNPTEPYT